MALKDYEFWFVVGSQFLYGPKVLETVAARAAEMVDNQVVCYARQPRKKFAIFGVAVLPDGGDGFEKRVLKNIFGEVAIVCNAKNVVE